VTSVSIHRASVTFGATRAVDDVSLDIPSGGWVALIGPNGAGKTTLLRAIAGLERAEGLIRLGSRPIAGHTARELARSIAFVPQRPVIPDAMTVTDYVLMGRTPYISYFGTESRHDVRIVIELFEALELTEMQDRPLGSLSGGEIQRVVLGRALAQQAPVLVLDEPTSALDVGHQQQILELVDRLRAERELTVVGAMHDLTLAAQFAESLVLMNEGRIVAAGAAADVLTEAAIETYYGAAVRVLNDEEGVHVIPRRARTAPIRVVR
jgi:iron complex transport system ATP-binding protein